MLDAHTMVRNELELQQTKQDIELLESTVATLFKAREYARDFHRLGAVKHLDNLISQLQDFKERIKDA